MVPAWKPAVHHGTLHRFVDRTRVYDREPCVRRLCSAFYYNKPGCILSLSTTKIAFSARSLAYAGTRQAMHVNIPR
ncbi:MAG: hypothetical protein WCK15_12200, partial [Pirellula sp.]